MSLGDAGTSLGDAGTSLGDAGTSRVTRAVIAILLMALGALPAAAQESPRAGGELVFVVPAEPPTYDAHREETFAIVHPAAPHYSTLLRVDPFDRGATRLVGDVAESWSVSKDGLAYRFTLRRGVRFHDGSELGARDVKATYDKIIFPPPGVMSNRKGEYLAVEAVEAPDPQTVIFRLKWPSPSFLPSLASPFNWIYKADILARDPHWYERNIMGSGPFLFVEYVKGSHWTGKRNPGYWDRGKPYLDGYRAIFIQDSAAQVAAIRGERAMIQFRGFSPPQRDRLVEALGPKITVQESTWECVNPLAINHERKPFDDKRVRRALTLALDRWQGAPALSKISILNEVAGVQGPGTPYAATVAELERLAGYGRDIGKSRAEARRLLREAGVPEGFTFTFKNRGIPNPYEALGVWLADQWRQISVTAKVETLELGMLYADIRSGNFEVAADFHCSYIVEPDLALFKFQSVDLSPVNYGRYTDRVLDELYQKQSRTSDREERRRLIREFEKRLLDDEAHFIYTLQWHRIVPHSARVRGWTITPSHFLNNQLDTVWLTE
jgi:peptide/nickel transport system substrate-binding protein